MGLVARPSRRARRRIIAGGIVALVAGAIVGTAGPAYADDGGVSDAAILGIWEPQSLNGVNNNPFFPFAGSAGQNYIRLASPRYADGYSAPVSGPNNRYISNRIYNDLAQNIFSERRVSHWGNTWGQFIDHNVGLAKGGGPTANIAFNSTDPLESFTNNLGSIPFTRTAAASGTGVSNARQQVNRIDSFIDGDAVYGNTDVRLDWLREGTVDGNPDNNGARLLMPNNYLPRRDARGSASTAPAMDIDGHLLSDPNSATVAGDVRANENLGLNAVQTLFAREHNRLVAQFPSWVSQEDKYQLARAVIIAEIQHITYTQFLPAMGISLPTYNGYHDNYDPDLENEFATVGYRAHSQIHGEVDIETNASRYSSTTLSTLASKGVEVVNDGVTATLTVPLNVAFFNPTLLPMIQLGPMLTGLANESEYRNDEMIDNQLRSVLFRVPSSTNPGCLDGPTLPQCFNGVVDLGAIDAERGRDHGMPTYNQLRAVYGLPAKTSFAAITGESTESFPSDPLLTPGNEINDPNSLDFTALYDINGNLVQPGTDAAANTVTRAVRRTTTAARLKAIYGNVNNVEAFVGMMAEPHIPGTEFGELQRAVWTHQFQWLRDGDRFFYLNDPLQDYIYQNFGINSHRTLQQIITDNTDTPISVNPFLAPATALAAAAATVGPSSTQVTDGTLATAPSSRITRKSGTSATQPTRPGTGVAVTIALGTTTGSRVGRRRERRRAGRRVGGRVPARQ